MTTSSRNSSLSAWPRSGSADFIVSDLPGGLALACRATVIAARAGYYLITAGLVATGLLLLRGRLAAQRHLSRRLVALMQRLGPAFIKGGQILGTRRDVVPRMLCDALAVLHDAVAPLSPAASRAVFDAVYGAARDDVFAHIDYCPVASGSIACVYRGQLRSGRDVAIKLQRPGIGKIMAADLTLITRACAVAARLPVFRGTPIREVMSYLCGAIYTQLDFWREAANLKQLRVNLSAVPRLWVPRIEEEASRDRAVVMEFIPGLDRAIASTCPDALRRKFAAGTLNAVYHMLFIDGFVHCDLHPGNLYYTKSGQVVVLDAGFSAQMPERIRRLFAEFFMNMGLGRGQRCAEIVIESASAITPEADLAGFTSHLVDLVERNSGLAARAFSLINFAAELFDLQRRFGLHAATELVFPLLSLLVIEGTVRDLDPDMDFQRAAQPILTQGLFGLRRNDW